MLSLAMLSAIKVLIFWPGNKNVQTCRTNPSMVMHIAIYFVAVIMVWQARDKLLKSTNAARRDFCKRYVSVCHGSKFNRTYYYESVIDLKCVLISSISKFLKSQNKTGNFFYRQSIMTHDTLSIMRTLDAAEKI